MLSKYKGRKRKDWLKAYRAGRTPLWQSRRRGELKSNIHGEKWEYTDEENHFYDR